MQARGSPRFLVQEMLHIGIGFTSGRVDIGDNFGFDFSLSLSLLRRLEKQLNR